MKSNFTAIALSIVVALAALHAVVMSIEWVYQLAPGIGRGTIEIAGVVAMLIVLTIGFYYLVRRLRPRVIVGVVAALVYFPSILFVHFCLSILTGLYDTL